MINTEYLYLAFFLNFVYHLPAACWVGIPPSTAADLVMPRMRAVAGAYYLLVNTFIGLALGPYVMGQISDYYVGTGMNDADALWRAITVTLLIFIPTLTFLTLAWRNLPKDEASRLDRARGLGEAVQELGKSGP